MSKAQKVQLAIKEIELNRGLKAKSWLSKDLIEAFSNNALAIVDVSEVEIPDHLQTDEFLEAWANFLDMRKSIRKAATLRAKKLIMKKLGGEPLDTAILMLEQATESSWTTVYIQRSGSSGRRFDDVAKEFES